MPTDVALSVGLSVKTKSVIALRGLIKSDIEKLCPFNSYVLIEVKVVQQ